MRLRTGESRPGPIPGYLPLPGPRNRNGLPSGGGYRYRGHAGWYPEAGVHLDPSVVTEKPVRLLAHQVSRAERIAEFCEARGLGFTRDEAGELVGITGDTVRRYEREYQERAARAGGEPS